MYEIVFTNKALKQISKLDKKTQSRIIAGIEKVRVRPFSFVKRLVGHPFFRLRVGDYRIILDIVKDKVIVWVLEVKHRKNVYK